MKLIERIGTLAPFGIGHAQPVFASGPLKIKSFRLLGKEKKHIKLYLEDPQSKTKKLYEAILWSKAEEFLADYHSHHLENDLYIAYATKINDFNGEKLVQLDIKDWKSSKTVDESIFSRLKQKPQKFIKTSEISKATML